MEMEQKYNGKKVFVVKKELLLNGISGDNFKCGRMK